MRKSYAFFLILLWALTACLPQDEVVPDGPQLVGQVTLTGLSPQMTSQPQIVIPTNNPVTPENASPLSDVTVDASFVIVTPTLPPSKTPTTTPTMTQTPTTTPSPTMTNTSTATAFLLPTSNIVAATQAVIVPNNQICDTNWFFIQPRPDSCPLNPPNVGPGVYQEFENGYMIWVGT